MVTTFLQFINTLLTHITIFLIKLYQYTLSPDKGLLSPILKNRICPHQPHCSEYAIQTLKRYGFRKGIGKATDRILHCKPRMEKIYDPAHYRIVFFSSAPIGVPFLERLANDKRFEIVGVVTQADKPVGRGLQMQENIIKTITLQQGLLSTADNLHTPTKINPNKSLEGKAFYNRLQDKKADFLVVIAYGKILPQSILDLAHFGAINVHGSLLPKFRGASPLQSIFLHNEPSHNTHGTNGKLKSGLTIMKMDAGMDTGDIIDTLSFPIPFHRTVIELIKALQQQGPQFLNDTLWNFGKGLITPMKQKEEDATYCQKIEKTDGFFVLSTDSLAEIYAKYRALALRPKARFIWQEKRIIIEKLILDEQLFEIHKTAPLLENGKLNAAVQEILLKPEGKKAMDWKSFVNGYLK